jgi:hypothetical protein
MPFFVNLANLTLDGHIVMKNILIIILTIVSIDISAQRLYTTQYFSYGGELYEVIGYEKTDEYASIHIRNTANIAATLPKPTGAYEDCTIGNVVNFRYLFQKTKEAINGAIDAQTRYQIRQNETFSVRLVVIVGNKVEPVFELRVGTIITPAQIYAMDMAIRQISIAFEPKGPCAGINLHRISITLPNQPSID